MNKENTSQELGNFSMLVPTELITALKIQAAKERRAMKEIAIELLKKYLKKHEE